MDFSSQAPGISQRASEIQNLLEQAIEQLRDISNELNPSIVERAGLQFALERLADKTRKNFTGRVALAFRPRRARAHRSCEDLLQDRRMRRAECSGAAGLLA